MTPIERDDAPWVVAKDVCEALGLANVTDAIGKLDEDEKMTLALTERHSGQRGGPREMNVIADSGFTSSSCAAAMR